MTELARASFSLVDQTSVGICFNLCPEHFNLKTSLNQHLLNNMLNCQAAVLSHKFMQRQMNRDKNLRHTDKYTTANRTTKLITMIGYK